MFAIKFCFNEQEKKDIIIYGQKAKWYRENYIIIAESICYKLSIQF